MIGQFALDSCPFPRLLQAESADDERRGDQFQGQPRPHCSLGHLHCAREREDYPGHQQAASNLRSRALLGRHSLLLSLPSDLNLGVPSDELEVSAIQETARLGTLIPSPT